MTDLPPASGPEPSGPAPGWYPDPVTGTGHRYWNGFAWTEDHNLDPGGVGGGVQPAGAWFSETFSLIVGRALDLLVLITILSIPLGLLSGLLIYEVLADGRLLFEYNADDQLTNIDAEGFGGPVVWAGMALLANFLGGFVLAGAVSRMAVFARTGRPEPWSSSLVGGFKRAHRVLGVSLFIGLLVALTLVVTAFFVVILVVTIPLLIYLVVRLSLATTSAAVAPRGKNAISNSIDLTQGFGWSIFGRLVLLLLVIFVAQVVVGVASAPFGSGGGTSFQNGDTELLMSDILGGSRFVFAFQQILGAIVGGFASALYGAGMAVLYLDRGGELDPEFAMESPFES